MKGVPATLVLAIAMALALREPRLKMSLTPIIFEQRPSSSSYLRPCILPSYAWRVSPAMSN